MTNPSRINRHLVKLDQSARIAFRGPHCIKEVALIETVYTGPKSTLDLIFQGQVVKIVKPSDPDRLLEDQDVLDRNRLDDYMPYWAYLWPGAFLLAEAVARETWKPGLRGLEIGCGLGLAGLVGMARGLAIDFSDYDQAPLGFVEESVAANGFDPSSFALRQLDWRDLPADRYPLILGADVLYERRLVPLVCNLLQTMLEPEGEAIVAGPYRVATEDLPAQMSRFGLVAESSPIETHTPELGRIQGVVHRIRRRSN